MPHFTLEYTSNLKAEGRISELLATVNRVLVAQGGVYPLGGIRSRAIELTDYCVADGEADYAFAHATLKIATGRSDAVKKKTCDELFEAIKAHFADLFARRYLALSLDLVEFGEQGSYKHNNIHNRFRKTSSANSRQLSANG
jgi:5-carboxymethyl-2-hydroxymuconate isomerase